MDNLFKTIGIAALVLTGMLTGFAQDSNYSWKGYPETAKTPSQTKLLIERKVPKTVRPNKPYSYEIKLTNRSYNKLDEIILVEKLPAGFKMVKVTPPPDKQNGNALMWNFGFMAPGQKEIITITGVASKPGKIVHRGNADLNFHLGQMTAIMEVVNPSINFTIEAKDNAIISEVFPAKMTFTNNGTATVLDAVLEHSLSGLTTSNGNSKIRIEIGDLQPGDTKSYPVKFKAVKVGKFDNNFIVKAKDGVTDSAKMSIAVKQPKLKLTATAPEMRYVGNNIKYKLAVKNSGDGVAKNLVAQLNLPNGTKVTAADEAGKTVGNGVIWNLGSLQPGDTKQLTATVKGIKIMKVKATAAAKAFAAPAVSTSMTTDVQGIPALLLKVDDINDPVAIGETETYKVYVTNTGSLAATGINVVCKLENSMQYVSSSGPTRGALNGKQVVFGKLKSLEVGKTATWTIVVKALKEGDVRFGAFVKCDQLQSQVSEYESTNFYE